MPAACLPSLSISGIPRTKHWGAKKTRPSSLSVCWPTLLESKDPARILPWSLTTWEVSEFRLRLRSLHGPRTCPEERSGGSFSGGLEMPVFPSLVFPGAHEVPVPVLIQCFTSPGAPLMTSTTPAHARTRTHTHSLSGDAEDTKFQEESPSSGI